MGVGGDLNSSQKLIYESCWEDSPVLDLFLALALVGEEEWCFFHLILIRLSFFDDVLPSKGWTSKVWVGINAASNSETSRCFALNGDSEGREPNIS